MDAEDRISAVRSQVTVKGPQRSNTIHLRRQPGWKIVWKLDAVQMLGGGNRTHFKCRINIEEAMLSVTPKDQVIIAETSGRCDQSTQRI